jgi:hypothetical protein
MKLFRLTGIQYPGRVNLYKRGTVELADISDELAMVLYKEGIPYLEPTPEGRKILFPDEKTIEVKTFKEPDKKPAQKKTLSAKQ